MGHKISWEDSEKLGMSGKHDSIYAPVNKYGYKIAVNHPKIKPLYERYKKKVGAIILSDKQRREFEHIIINMIERRKKQHEQSAISGSADG